MTTLRLVVRGTPGAQGSKVSYGKKRMVESSTKVAPWRQDVKAAAEQAMTDETGFPITGPVAVDIVFLFPRPKGHYGTGRNATRLRDHAPAYPTGRNLGDVDKLVRSTLDALTAAGVLADDSLVVNLNAVKRWSDGAALTSGADITVAGRPS